MEIPPNMTFWMKDGIVLVDTISGRPVPYEFGSPWLVAADAKTVSEICISQALSEIEQSQCDDYLRRKHGIT